MRCVNCVLVIISALLLLASPVASAPGADKAAPAEKSKGPAPAPKSGGGSATQSTAGQPGSPSNDVRAGAITRDFCMKDVRRADPNNPNFEPKCGACVAAAFELGMSCVEPTISTVSECRCTDFIQDNCYCQQTFSFFGLLVFVFVPLLLAGIALTLYQCAREPFFPVYQAYKAKVLGSDQPDELTRHEIAAQKQDHKY